ncbi:MAG: hypothetical protein R3Y57_00460 [Erysipelotrichaceae bacterium]
MKTLYRYRWVLIALLISLVFTYPYIVHEVSYEHDTFFHLSRIEGLAKAFANQEFFPSIYFDKNNLYGYASALFYADFFLYPFALLYHFGLSLMNTYKLLLFFYTFLGNLLCVYFVKRFFNKNHLILLAMILFTFATYRLTNVYVRGALQEIIAYSFMPLVLAGIYDYIYKGKWLVLSLGFTCLVLSHNITFILSCYLFLVFILLHFKKLIVQKRWLPLTKAILLCVALTAFFTFGMIEQITSQSFYFQTDNTANIQSSSLHIYQFFQNGLNFNVSLQDFLGMIVNPGLGLLLLPLSYFLLLDKPQDTTSNFVKQMMIIGYILLFLQSSAIDLSIFKVFNFMQFTWRLNNLVCILLIVPSCMYLDCLCAKYPHIISFIIILLLANSIWLLSKPLERTNILANDLSYQQIIDGEVIDPYYSAFYMRVELAGADYLPNIYYDYKNEVYGIYNQENQLVSYPIADYDKLYFEMNLHEDIIILPKTYYKGYVVVNEYGEQLSTNQNVETGLVEVELKGETGNFTLYYQRTRIQLIGIIISSLTLLGCILYSMKKLLTSKIN